MTNWQWYMVETLCDSYAEFSASDDPDDPSDLGDFVEELRRKGRRHKLSPEERAQLESEWNESMPGDAVEFRKDGRGVVEAVSSLFA